MSTTMLVFTSETSISSPDDLLRSLLPFHLSPFSPDIHYRISPDSKTLFITPNPPIFPELVTSTLCALVYLGHPSITVSLTQDPPFASPPPILPLTFTPALMDHSILSDISSYLRVSYPDIVLIPSMNNNANIEFDKKYEKRPLYHHKGITSSVLHSKWDSRKTIYEHGILAILRAQPDSPQMIVIDVDSHELASSLAVIFPCLKLAPRQETRKGVHFFFKADDGLLPRLTDNALQVRTFIIFNYVFLVF